MARATTIGYYDELGQEWSKLIDDSNQASFTTAVERWGDLCWDALALVSKWTPADFRDWRSALASERRGKYMGDERMVRFGAVIMPEILMRVSLVAGQFKVPEGLAFIRLRELGRLQKKGKRWVWMETKVRAHGQS